MRTLSLSFLILIVAVGMAVAGPNNKKKGEDAPAPAAPAPAEQPAKDKKKAKAEEPPPAAPAAPAEPAKDKKKAKDKEAVAPSAPAAPAPAAPPAANGALKPGQAVGRRACLGSTGGVGNIEVTNDKTIGVATCNGELKRVFLEKGICKGKAKSTKLEYSWQFADTTGKDSVTCP